MSMNDIVTVVNRTSKILKATWDGKPYDLPPGETHLPRVVARAARYQNPVMGRGTPMEDWNIRSEYLIGIKEDADPITPIEQSTSPQRWDTEAVNGDQYQIVRPRGGAFAEVCQSVPLVTQDGGFSKP